LEKHSLQNTYTDAVIIITYPKSPNAAFKDHHCADELLFLGLRQWKREKIIDREELPAQPVTSVICISWRSFRSMGIEGTKCPKSKLLVFAGKFKQRKSESGQTNRQTWK
jgi:hypothetical protein